MFCQPNVLKFFIADLIAEIFVLRDKPDLPENSIYNEVGEFCFTLKSSSFPNCFIGLMNIALVYHTRMMDNDKMKF
jgi:hypothetical protein